VCVDTDRWKGGCLTSRSKDVKRERCVHSNRGRLLIYK
jgi:hypothetical protein